MYRSNHRKRQLATADAETLKRIRERPPQLKVQREGLCLVRHHGLDIEPGAERRSVAVDNRAAHIATPTQHLLRRQHRLEYRKFHAVVALGTDTRDLRHIVVNRHADTFATFLLHGGPAGESCNPRSYLREAEPFP